MQLKHPIITACCPATANYKESISASTPDGHKIWVNTDDLKQYKSDAHKHKVVAERLIEHAGYNHPPRLKTEYVYAFDNYTHTPHYERASISPKDTTMKRPEYNEVIPEKSIVLTIEVVYSEEDYGGAIKAVNDALNPLREIGGAEIVNKRTVMGSFQDVFNVLVARATHFRKYKD